MITMEMLEEWEAAGDVVGRLVAWGGEGPWSLANIADNHPDVADLLWLLDRVGSYEQRQAIACTLAGWAMADAGIEEYANNVTPQNAAAARAEAAAAMAAWAMAEAEATAAAAWALRAARAAAMAAARAGASRDVYADIGPAVRQALREVTP